MPSALLAFRLRSRLECQKQVGAGGFGGLESGGWNWQFLPSLYLGWAAGLILSIIAGVFLFWTERPWYLRLLALLLAAPTITLTFSTAYYFVALLPERKARAANMALLERAKDDPSFVDSLVKRARAEELAPMERIVIGQTLGTKNRYSDSDVAFLLEYFQKDISAVAAIMGAFAGLGVISIIVPWHDSLDLILNWLSAGVVSGAVTAVLISFIYRWTFTYYRFRKHLPVERCMANGFLGLVLFFFIVTTIADLGAALIHVQSWLYMIGMIGFLALPYALSGLILVLHYRKQNAPSPHHRAASFGGCLGTNICPPVGIARKSLCRHDRDRQGSSGLRDGFRTNYVDRGREIQEEAG